MHAQTLQIKGIIKLVQTPSSRKCEQLILTRTEEEALRAVHKVSQTRQQLRSLLNFIASHNHGNNREYTCNLLKAKHETLNKRITCN